MTTTGGGSAPAHKTGPAQFGPEISPEHYLRLLLHRKWLVLAIFVVVSAATCIYTSRLPNVFTSETVILVDPQKVPESYVKSTVTGDIRDRLGTLSQQILSATRLQKIIEEFNLFPEERKTMAREDVISRMRADISVNVLSEFSSGQDLQAFRISYSGREPRLVAQVTNELASLFIEENLKAREQQAQGTTEFLENQLQDTRKVLESQEAKLRDFKLKHLGEMPEQQAADLQILGQLQGQLQMESDALTRAEQQRTYIQSVMAQSSAPVVDLDPVTSGKAPAAPAPAAKPPASNLRARLAALLSRGYTEKHPEIRRLRAEIAQEEAASQAASAVPAASAPPHAPVLAAAPQRPVSPTPYVNPVLEAQLQALDAEISKHKDEQQRLSKLAAAYKTKLEAIPVNEQKISDLARDYQMSKDHYSQLLEKQLAAQTATQLEVRQKGERFSILDPAQPAEKPSSPKRALLDLAGCLSGLMLGLLAAIASEFVGPVITAPEQITEISGMSVLEIIPNIETQADRRHKKRVIWATGSGLAASIIASGAILLFHYRLLG